MQPVQPTQPVAILQPVAVVQSVPEADFERQNRFMSIWRSSARSILTLVTTCLFTLLTIFTLKNAVAFLGYMPDLIGYSEENILHCLRILLQYVTFVLICVGLWLHYAEGWKKNKCRIGTAGTTVIRVGLYLMLASIALYATTTAMDYSESVGAYNSEYMQEQMILYVIQFVLYSFETVCFAIIAGRIGTSAKKSAAFSTEPRKLTSSAVLLFMMATLDFLLAFYPMFLYSESYYDTETIIYLITLFIVYVLLGVLLLTHKNKLDTAAKESVVKS